MSASCCRGSCPGHRTDTGPQTQCPSRQWTDRTGMTGTSQQRWRPPTWSRCPWDTRSTLRSRWSWRRSRRRTESTWTGQRWQHGSRGCRARTQTTTRRGPGCGRGQLGSLRTARYPGGWRRFHLDSPSSWQHLHRRQVLVGTCQLGRLHIWYTAQAHDTHTQTPTHTTTAAHSHIATQEWSG